MTTEYAGNSDHPVFLGRQPILDREQRIVAYELLFRSSAGRNAALIDDDFAATSEVVVRAFTDMGLTSVLGDCLGFINVDERFLVSEMVELLPRERVVLEVLETVEITPKVIARLSELKAMGFQLALDDYSDVRPDYAAALSVVDVVKVDLPLVKSGELSSIVQHLRRWPPKILAEKVDNNEQFQTCSQLGFELFQGYFFAKPTILVGRRVDPAQVGVLRLMNLVLGDAEVGSLEEEFKRYPNLTYKLLRLVNSVAFGIPTKIHSLRQALVLLGKRQVQRWLQLLLFTQQADGAPGQPLLTLAAARGKQMELMMEHLAPGNREKADRAFMVGMLSLLDALLGAPLPEVLAELNLVDPVRVALLSGEGTLGHLLEIVRLFEQNRFAEATQRLLSDLPSLSLWQVNQTQLQALSWANELSASNSEK